MINNYELSVRHLSRKIHCNLRPVKYKFHMIYSKAEISLKKWKAILNIYTFKRYSTILNIQSITKTQHYTFLKIECWIRQRHDIGFRRTAEIIPPRHRAGGDDGNAPLSRAEYPLFKQLTSLFVFIPHSPPPPLRADTALTPPSAAVFPHE